MEKRLKLGQNNRAAANRFSNEESSVVMLERLRAIKDKYTALCSQMSEIAAAQKVSKFSIQENLNSNILLVQHIQRAIGVEVHSEAESVPQLVGLFNTVGESTAEERPVSSLIQFSD
ncbi:spindle and kinetochore-associated protein 2 isoform X2 [Syngnathoides biaculeatus]|nr:spindle and kinetochore-associated protein 2 isoform X2 [Syngnathoides biaculeatus]